MGAVAHHARVHLGAVGVVKALDVTEPPRAMTINVFADLARSNHPILVRLGHK